MQTIKPAFIITVDTEGDNLWIHRNEGMASTENAKFLEPFQMLCDRFSFPPVYLTNYEMANCDTYVSKAKLWQAAGLCEVGIHIHAWNNPPFFELQGDSKGNAYLIEYPTEVMKAKFKMTYDLITHNFGVAPVSHRAGRWTMDERYFNILTEFGILVDCSYTPGINWNGNSGHRLPGSNYTKISPFPCHINGILEVPMTIRRQRRLSKTYSIRTNIRNLIKGKDIWLRPAISDSAEMRGLIDSVMKESQFREYQYVELMLHSSELMPGGSPYFKTQKDINILYKTLEEVFGHLKSCGFVGMTLKDYYYEQSK